VRKSRHVLDIRNETSNGVSALDPKAKAQKLARGLMTLINDFSSHR